MPALITIPAAGIVAAIFGAALYFPIYRTKGHYIALVSLAFQFIIVLALDNLAFTGGPQGLKSIPSISIFGYDFLSTPGGLHFYTNYYYFTLLIVVLTVIFFHRLHNSWVGLTLSYIRDDEIAARCFGVNSSAWQLIAFMTGTFFMGIGGSIYAHMVGFISPPNFLFIESLAILAIVIIGGMDNIVGVIIGTAILVIVPEKLRVITEYRILLYGLILIIMLLFRPEGLLPMKAREYHDLLVTRLKRKTAEKSGVQG
jgi:branched-chain amino acid transport system permease protein